MKILTVLLALGLSVFSHGNNLSFYGVAYDLKSKVVVYREDHQVTLDESGQYLRSIVTYSSATGQVFATKTVDYEDSKTVPNIRFNDSRAKISINIEKLDNNIKVSYKSLEDDVEEVLKQVSDLVVDAGFDQMLLQQWEKLLKEETLSFEFLLPTRAQLVDFELIPKGQDQEVIRFALQPENFILNMLVDPVLLTYDKKYKRILRYKGLTNISKFEKGDDTGEYYTAIIEYHYPET